MIFISIYASLKRQSGFSALQTEKDLVPRHSILDCLHCFVFYVKLLLVRVISDTLISRYINS